jgi:ribosomal protein L32
VAAVFSLGCAATLPAAIIEHVTGAALAQETLLASAEVSFLLIGPVEESFKLVAVWIGVYRSDDFREPIDGIVYATSAALGFASVENIIYMGYMGPEILLSRTVFATPAHVMFSSMWGYSLGLARFRRQGELAIVSKGLLVAAVLHGVYNFIVAIHPKAAVVSLIPLMVFMALLMSRRIREFRRTFPFAPIGEGPVICCPNCGVYTLERSRVCSRCGFEIPALETDTPRFCGRCRARLDPCRNACSRCGEPIDLSHLCDPVSSLGTR